MENVTVSRRKLIGAIGLLAIAAPILQACSSAAPAPAATTASSGGQAASSSSTSSSGQATAAPAKQAAAGGSVNMSIAVYAGANRTWMPRFAKEWATKNPSVKLSIAQIDYGQMDKKTLAELSSGTMQDIVFSSVKWMPYDAVKEAFLAIDDYTKQTDPGLSDFIPAALNDCKFDGKLWGLPFEFNTGNNNVVYYNKDMVQAKGAKEPVDTWTTEDYTAFTVALTDKSKGIWGTDLFPGNYYDLGTYARAYGGGVLNLPDFKKFTLTTDPKTVAAAKWMVELRTVHKVAPSRAESQNMSVMFPSQKLASTAGCICSYITQRDSVKDKFKWAAVLGPTGPDGGRGYDSFAAIWNIYAKSKNPDLAYSLLMGMTTKEAATWAVHNDNQPPARTSVWRDPDLNKQDDIYSRIADWVTNGKDQGPFPLPNNLRYSELNDKWTNVSPALFYGEVDFDKGMQTIQDECQKIMDLPRP